MGHEAPGPGGGPHARSPVTPAGLTVAEGDLTLVPTDVFLPEGRPAPFSFRILRGTTVVDRFDVIHDRAMHLIVVRRDLMRFQHVHPTMQDGTWTVELAPLEAGVWRAFADFSTEGANVTLGTDLHVEGRYIPERLSDPATEQEVGDYTVRLSAGEHELLFDVERGGAPVELEPYLGARGHLVALREGDLAFLHVHPMGDRLEFAVAYPTPGRYRLFLQFAEAGTVHLAAFTADAPSAG